MQFSLRLLKFSATRARRIEVLYELDKLGVDVFRINGANTGFGDVCLMLIYVLIAARTRDMLEELAVALEEGKVCLLIERHIKFDPTSSVLELIRTLLPCEALHLGCTNPLSHLAELLRKFLSRSFGHWKTAEVLNPFRGEKNLDGPEGFVYLLEVCLKFVYEHRQRLINIQLKCFLDVLLHPVRSGEKLYDAVRLLWAEKSVRS